MTAMLVTSVILSVTFAIYTNSDSSDRYGSAGEISLRSYYDSGTGTLGDPYVITRPRHLYNLSRLQGLGVYDLGPNGERTYFQIGRELDPVNHRGEMLCYKDETSEMLPYLDMRNSDYYNNPINAIGSEAQPFYGLFDGKNVEIKNLTVYADPEDAGLFGYIAHGSRVENLFLSNVTINAMGYTDDYANLYDAEEAATNFSDACYTYNPNTGDSSTSFYTNTISKITSYYYDTVSEETFEYDDNADVPTITFPSKYTTLLSGNLIKIENNVISPNLDELFTFFGQKKDAQGAEFPIKASSTASLVATSLDNNGIKHSKVVLTLKFDFTLQEASSKFISMDVYTGAEHGNNIGLIIGHCDGTAIDCYVYNGRLNMNNGDSITESEVGTYNKLPNGSNIGLIGLVGGTVQNVLSGSGLGNGKEVGIVDFTTIYKDIVNKYSFSTGTDPSDSNYHDVVDDFDSYATTFLPVSTSKYLNYLRQDNRVTNPYTKYITAKIVGDGGNVEPVIAFKGQEVITSDELGVFTVATDPGAALPTDNLDTTNSLVKTEDVSILNGTKKDYYIYYSTGEYSSTYNSNYKTGATYSNYRSSYNSDNPTHLIPGYHIPNSQALTIDTPMMYRNMETREQRQNYVIRFKLEPILRKTSGKYYFADLDGETDGGSFLSNYFNYKLVDLNNDHIPTTRDECGVLLRPSATEELQSISASFTLPDLSDGTQAAVMSKTIDGVTKNYVGNMINFEITSADYANVTVLAAPDEQGKPAAVGIYKIDDGDIDTSKTPNRFTQKYNEPDYAFFMPDDNHLAYFDYGVDSDGKGQIGKWAYNDSTQAYEIDPATYATDAIIPNKPGYTEYGYESGKTRIFAHTFYLPAGRYCIGSASGASGGSGETTAKIFYVCAQGQNAGNYGYDDNVFSGNDIVEKIDFIKQPRFADNGTENIKLTATTTYGDPGEEDCLVNQRLYVSLVNSDRSLFSGDYESYLIFEYLPDATFEDDGVQKTGYFAVRTTLDSQTIRHAILHVAVNNYNHSCTSGSAKVLYVKLFDRDPNNATILSYSP